MLLKPNLSWPQNKQADLPIVQATYSHTPNFFHVEFIVEEPMNCFRAEVRENNGRSWEDSCVEIFLQNPANAEEYFNFETTSRGFMLAARGTGRENRTTLSESDIAAIRRTTQLASIAGDLVCWSITIDIPAKLFGIATFEGATLRGNLYKCADKAKTPHYLSVFPIQTEKPDFHRPEFFQDLV